MNDDDDCEKYRVSKVIIIDIAQPIGGLSTTSYEKLRTYFSKTSVSSYEIAEFSPGTGISAARSSASA